MNPNWLKCLQGVCCTAWVRLAKFVVADDSSSYNLSSAILVKYLANHPSQYVDSSSVSLVLNISVLPV